MADAIAIEWDAPTSYPLDLRRIKEQLRIDHDELDDLIMNQHLPAAFEWAEGETHRSLISREHRWILSQFPSTGFGTIRLPRGKTQSVSGIDYISNTATVSLAGPSSSPAGTAWIEDLGSDAGGRLLPAQTEFWPSADENHPTPVKITFHAGYLAADFPNDLALAIMFYIGDALFMTNAADLPRGADPFFKDALVSSYRIHRW